MTMYYIFSMLNITEKAMKIKVEMLKKRLSGADIARKAGVDRSAVYHVIAGRSQSKRLRQAIADALDMSYNEVWED